jgi:hypothetical protein
MPSGPPRTQTAPSTPGTQSPIRHPDHGQPPAIVRAFCAFANHPLVTIITGIGLLVTGTMEFLEDIIADFESVVQAYHGVLLMGITLALRGFASFAEGIEWLGRVAKDEQEEEAFEHIEDEIEDLRDGAGEDPRTGGATLTQSN